MKASSSAGSVPQVGQGRAGESDIGLPPRPVRPSLNSPAAGNLPPASVIPRTRASYAHSRTSLASPPAARELTSECRASGQVVMYAGLRTHLYTKGGPQ